MKYLIDTHVCLWAFFEKQKLSAHVKSLLENTDIEILVSQITLWEIAIKYQIGKLPDFRISLEKFITTISIDGFTLLPIKDEHIIAYFANSFFTTEHRDPFDRLLISIADYEQMPFITKDEKFDAYKDRVNIIW